MLLPVKPHDHALAVDLRIKVHRPPPDARDIPQGIPRVIKLQVRPLVLVHQHELRTVLVVPVDDFDHRLAEVRQAGEELVLHLLELAVGDLPPVALLVEGIHEQLLLDRELRRQELVDEGDVVVVLADLEDLLPPEPRVGVPLLARDHVVALVVRLAESAAVPGRVPRVPEWWSA